MVVDGASDDDEAPEEGYGTNMSTLQANLEGKGSKSASGETKAGG